MPTKVLSLTDASTLASRFFDTFHLRFGALYNRWQDERKYEDFEDYRDTVRRIVLEAGGTFIRLTKRFRLTFEMQGVVYDLFIKGDRIIMEEHTSEDEG